MEETTHNMKLKNILALSCVILVGCIAPLKPGADPLVVRTEQSLKVSDATFNFVLHVEDSNHAFWKQNVPGFVNFCEWLRTPTPYEASTLPRCNALLLTVNDLKNKYKSAKTEANSNALYTIVLTLDATASQATAWSNIIVLPIY